MLVVTLKRGRSVFIGPNIRVLLCQTRGGNARLGIEASPELKIVREDAKDKTPTDRKGRQHEPAATDSSESNSDGPSPLRQEAEAGG